MRRRMALRVLLVFAIVPLGSFLNTPSAVAHGTCTPYMDVRSYIDPVGTSAYGGEFSLFCSDEHYSYQGRAHLQNYVSGSWNNVKDSGVRYDCCNLKNPAPDDGAFGWSTGISNICPPSGTLTLRVYINYIEVINAKGNIGHRYASLAEAPEHFACG
jgi:hypothetical protein